MRKKPCTDRKQALNAVSKRVTGFSCETAAHMERVIEVEIRRELLSC